MKPKRGDFWVFNISSKDVMISDLRIKIPKGKYLNLLSGNNAYTIEELLKSAESGSLLLKRDKIKITRVQPRFNIPKPPPLEPEMRITQLRSSIQEEDDILPELQLLDSLLPEDDEDQDIVEKNIKKVICTN